MDSTQPTTVQFATYADPSDQAYWIYTLTFNQEALSNLRNNRHFNELLQKDGQDLVKGLIVMGAKLNNAMKGGDLIPAVQLIDCATGNPRVLVYYKDNQMQDPPQGIPAFQTFNPLTRKVIHQEHYQADRLQDPCLEEPAVKNYYDETGIIVSAESYSGGMQMHVLDDSELVALNRRKMKAHSSPGVQLMPRRMLLPCPALA